VKSGSAELNLVTVAVHGTSLYLSSHPQRGAVLLNGWMNQIRCQF